MIIGQGIDILEISRVKDVFLKNPKALTEKILSSQEMFEFQKINSNERKIIFLAKRFSVKEAIGKAIGCGVNNEHLILKDITIHHNSYGKPFVLKNRSITDAVRLFCNASSYNLTISIADTKQYVVSQAILEKKAKVSSLFGSILNK